MSPTLYENDQPDARQQPEGQPQQKPSRFRTRYRQLNSEEITHHDLIKTVAEELAQLIEKTPDPRYRALALTELEKAVFWAVKGLTG